MYQAFNNVLHSSAFDGFASLLHGVPVLCPHCPRRLSCLMYQRSADLGLGIPFNIASYALFTHMIAQITDTEPHELIIQLGDAHVYKNHVEALQKQLKRRPRSFPKLHFKELKNLEDIEQLKYSSKDEESDFVIDGYQPHEAIVMKMSGSIIVVGSREVR